MSLAVDDLVELLHVARDERDRAWREAGQFIRDNSDDPEIVHLIDRCLTLTSNVRRLERLLAHE